MKIFTEKNKCITIFIYFNCKVKPNMTYFIFIELLLTGKSVVVPYWLSNNQKTHHTVPLAFQNV